MVINVQQNIAIMMKKIYNKPELMIVTLKPMHILAGSETMPTSTEEYNGKTPKLGKQGFGGWDDDEPGEDY